MFPNGWYKILTCVYGVPLNHFFALRPGAKISRCGAVGVANLRGRSRALELHKGTVNQQGCVHTLPGPETRETLAFSPLLLYQLDFFLGVFSFLGHLIIAVCTFKSKIMLWN